MRVGGPTAGRVNCVLCSFYDQVLQEEMPDSPGNRFTFTSELIAKLEGSDHKHH